jgi:hypothetical protein
MPGTYPCAINVYMPDLVLHVGAIAIMSDPLEVESPLRYELEIEQLHSLIRALMGEVSETLPKVKVGCNFY